MEEEVHAECVCTEVKRGPLSAPRSGKTPRYMGHQAESLEGHGFGVGPTEPQPKASLN